MKKIFVSLLILFSTQAFGVGKIQNEDVKSYADIKKSVATITGTLTGGSPCIASPSSTAKLIVGQFLYDTTTSSNISVGTTIIGLPGSCSAGQIKMSANAVGSGTDTITVGGQMSQLINDTKIYDTTNNQQLSTTIATIAVTQKPTKQVFTGGSGTYTLPTSPSPRWLRVRIVGAGGGGRGASGVGSSGGNTSFGSSFIVANGGGGGSGAPGTGGVAAGGVGDIVIYGGDGCVGNGNAGTTVSLFGGNGGSSAFGGAGAGGTTASGNNGKANSGGGGGGESHANGGGVSAGSGGGAGGYVESLITTPLSSYAYSVGAGGSGGTGTTTGGNGGDGIIIVEEFY